MALNTARRESQPELATDQRGAVMLIGLFLALAVIGALWCLIGIGNAILAREVSQEAADSAAFTNAVIHARGMNFIAFINIIVMALTMAYLLLTWFDVILSSVMLLTGTWEFGPNWCVWHYATWLIDIDLNYCQYARNVSKIEGPVFRLDQKIFERLKKVGPPLFEIQVWAATAVPYLGTEGALLTAADYERPITLSFSLSSFPGGGAIRPLNKLHVLDKIPYFQTGNDGPNVVQDKRIGLPVEAEPAFQLCVRGARFPLEWLKTTLGKNAMIGGRSFAQWTSTEPLGTLMNAGLQSIGETNHLLFCNEKKTPAPSSPDSCALSSEDASDSIDQLVKDWRVALSTSNDALRLIFYFGLMGARGGVNDKFYLKADEFWNLAWPNRGDKDGYSAGPKAMTQYAYNGNDWMQIWAVSGVPVESNTLAARIVSVPSRLFGRGQEADALASKADSPPLHVFLAQAEFYYDCAGVWESNYCNKAGAALYQMRWRARLRRFHHLNVLGDLSGLFFNDFLRGPVVQKIGSKLTSRLAPDTGRGLSDALRRDLAKLGNDSLFPGEQTSDEILH